MAWGARNLISTQDLTAKAPATCAAIYNSNVDGLKIGARSVPKFRKATASATTGLKQPPETGPPAYVIAA